VCFRLEADDGRPDERLLEVTMNKLASIALASILALGAYGSTPASAQWRGGWGHGGGGWGHAGWGHAGWGHAGWGHAGWGHGGWGWGAGAVAGLAGLAIGSVLASPTYGYGYGYPDDAYGYAYPA
jgi:hypothetical protein